MKRSYAVAILAGIFVFGISLGFLLRGCPCKIAVVDYVAVVSKSAQVASLQDEHLNKNKELLQWLQKVQDDVKAVSEDKEKEDLLQKYNEEFVQKKNEINKAYSNGLQKIDREIAQKITEYANKNGYKVVASKGLIISGGVDITEEIIKIVR